MSASDRILGFTSPREVICEAVRLLRETYDVSEADAFDLLVQESSTSHESVRDTASRVVADLVSAADSA